MYRDSRARGGYHSHSYRDAATHGYRHFTRRSISPVMRRSRGRSRSPFVRDNYEQAYDDREHYRSEYRERHDFGTRLMRERSFSNERNRDNHFNNGNRSRENTSWNENQQQQDNSSDVSRPKNDKYHWTNENYKPVKNHSRSIESQESQGDEIHDLREIIKRGREESEDCSHDSDGYFKEFIPNIQETRRNHKSRWSENEVLTFQKSIHNDIAIEESPETMEQDLPEEQQQHVSSMDTNPEIPHFNGVDQELTPRQFVKLIEEVGYKKGWSSSELKCQMAGKLLGAPREWFLKDELMNEPWDKVKVQFIKMHPMDMDYYQQLKKMMDRTMFEDESFSNYFTFKTMLMSAVGITGRRAVSCLIGGLRNAELEALCYQKNFPTPEFLFDFLSMHKEMEQNNTMKETERERKQHFSESPRKSDGRRHSRSEGRSTHHSRTSLDKSRDKESHRERDISMEREHRERPRERDTREQREVYRDREAHRDREHHREPHRDREYRERESRDTHRERQAHSERDTHREPIRDVNYREREREPPRERRHASREQDFRVQENFAPIKSDHDQHQLRVSIGNHQLEAYNDLASQYVTMKEETAKYIHFDYSRRRTTIIGYRGVPIMAMGDAEVRLNIDQATVKCTLFVVPNVCQEQAIVIGQSLRDHQDINYRESSSGAVFKQRTYLDSFSANEARKEKTNHIV